MLISIEKIQSIFVMNDVAEKLKRRGITIRGVSLNRERERGMISVPDYEGYSSLKIIDVCRQMTLLPKSALIAITPSTGEQSVSIGQDADRLMEIAQRAHQLTGRFLRQKPETRATLLEQYVAQFDELRNEYEKARGRMAGSFIYETDYCI